MVRIMAHLRIGRTEVVKTDWKQLGYV